MIQVKDEQIILFQNKDKQNNQPDFKGKAMFNGVEMDISIWMKDGANGKYLSGKVQKPFKKIENENQINTSEVQEEDIPF